METERPLESVGDMDCERCGYERYRIKRVDEFGTSIDSFIVFCGDCGKTAGKLKDWDSNDG